MTGDKRGRDGLGQDKRGRDRLGHDGLGQAARWSGNGETRRTLPGGFR